MARTSPNLATRLLKQHGLGIGGMLLNVGSTLYILQSQGNARKQNETLEATLKEARVSRALLEGMEHTVDITRKMVQKLLYPDTPSTSGESYDAPIWNFHAVLPTGYKQQNSRIPDEFDPDEGDEELPADGKTRKPPPNRQKAASKEWV